MRRGRGKLLLFAVVAVVVVVAACSTPPDARPSTALRDDAVTVASFDFSESELLGELYAQAIEARGIHVVRRLGLGPRELVGPALQRGLVELVPEYAGSLLAALTGDVAPPDLATVREELEPALADRGLVALGSAGAQNRNVFALTEQTARRLGIADVSDLARIEPFVLGGPPECPTRELCLLGLEGVYGLEIREFVALDGSGPLSAEALRRGIVDVVLLFSTSPLIDRHGFMVLRDDRDLQPAEHVTPIVHRETLDRFGPELAAAVDAVDRRLTTSRLRALNAEVELEGRSPALVARTWLAEHSLGPTEG